MTRVAADALVVEAQDLLRAEHYQLAAQRFERAAEIFPQHPLAWKGLGHALLCMGKAHEAAHAFDHAIGLAPTSATALWGGAVAHADIGNKVVAQNYLRRTLALQPTWVDMARGVPQLAPFLQVSTRGADALRRALGPFSTRTYRHANDDQRALEIGRLVDLPKVGLWTFVTIGLSNKEWPERGRPRCELVLATTVDTEVCGQILANLAFHLAETGYFPEPGMIVRDVVGALGAGDLSQRLPHVYITPPRLWRVELPIDPGPPAITLAQVVPVSENEYGLWRSNVSGFERALAQRGVDLTDLRRG
ncbi:MAG TPA: suppressor of fused domain protein [Kofleriaceae bacterium]|jgi:tetratricopeptide (TPR) repeat protein